VAVGDVFNNLDGLSRNDRLRYDTPAFGPLGFAVSATNGEAYEAAARLVQDMGDNAFEAAIGYVDGGDRSPFSQIGASASFLHASGFNVTVAIGERDLDEAGRSDSSEPVHEDRLSRRRAPVRYRLRHDGRPGG
jgi:hypothetical protein